MRRPHHLVLALLELTLCCAACTGTGKGSVSAQPATSTTAVAGLATVAYVVDGDTVDVLIDGIETRVRLIGIDTPETVDRDRPVECFGKEASAFTASVLPVGTEVRLERDVEPRDDYGRLLVYVFRLSDDLFVNLELARNGYAQPLTIPPNVAYSDRFVDAARAAEQADVGLWSACGG